MKASAIAAGIFREVKDTGPVAWLVLAAVLFVIGSVFSPQAEVDAHRKSLEASLENSLRQNGPGAFALNTVEECLSSGGLFGQKPTTAECINQTINAAKNIHDDQFANAVRSALAQKFAPGAASANR